MNKRVGFAEAANDDASVCEADSAMDLRYHGDKIKIVENETMDQSQGDSTTTDENIPSPSPGGGSMDSNSKTPAPAPKPYIASSLSSQGNSGMDGTHIAILAVVLGFLILAYVHLAKKRQRKREARFEEIQCTDLVVEEFEDEGSFMV